MLHHVITKTKKKKLFKSPIISMLPVSHSSSELSFFSLWAYKGSLDDRQIWPLSVITSDKHMVMKRGDYWESMIPVFSDFKNYCATCSFSIFDWDHNWIYTKRKACWKVFYCFHMPSFSIFFLFNNVQMAHSSTCFSTFPPSEKIEKRLLLTLKWFHELKDRQKNEKSKIIWILWTWTSYE